MSTTMKWTYPRAAALLTLAIVLLMATVVVRAQDGTQAVAAGAEPSYALFAGGCFWCLEPPFDRLPGVISTTSGYAGGTIVDPTYEQVSSGRSGHIEVVRIGYDPKVVSYETLLQVFWRNIDPVAVNRQFCDAGPQYRSAIFALDETQRTLAQESLRTLQASGRFDQPIATEILPAAMFYPAEDYHQDYYVKNPVRYKYYRYRCGRDSRLEQLWGKQE